MNPQIFRLTAGSDDTGLRLDQFIAKHLPGHSRRFLRKVIDEGGVYINRHRSRKQSRVVHAGDKVEVWFDETSEQTETYKIADLIIHQNKDFFAANKPAGINSLPTPTSAIDNLFYQMERQYGKLYPVHRLDRDTSGLILIARHKKAATELSRLFRGHAIRKTYLALCSSVPEMQSGQIDKPLLSRNGSGYVIVSPAGETAVTNYTVLKTENGNALLKLQPESGRMHQLRVHLQSIGCPVIGDRKYDGVKAKRLMLHALRLEFKWNNIVVSLEAPSPW